MFELVLCFAIAFCFLVPIVLFLCTKFTSDEMRYASDANAAQPPPAQFSNVDNNNSNNNANNHNNNVNNNNFNSDPRTTSARSGGAGGSIDGRVRPTEKVKVIQDNLRPTVASLSVVIACDFFLKTNALLFVFISLVYSLCGWYAVGSWLQHRCAGKRSHSVRVKNSLCSPRRRVVLRKSFLFVCVFLH
jgi:hypothetical protein